MANPGDVSGRKKIAGGVPSMGRVGNAPLLGQDEYRRERRSLFELERWIELAQAIRAIESSEDWSDALYLDDLTAELKERSRNITRAMAAVRLDHATFVSSVSSGDFDSAFGQVRTLRQRVLQWKKGGLSRPLLEGDDRAIPAPPLIDAARCTVSFNGQQFSGLKQAFVDLLAWYCRQEDKARFVGPNGARKAAELIREAPHPLASLIEKGPGNSGRRINPKAVDWSKRPTSGA